MTLQPALNDVKFNIVTGLLKALPDAGDGVKRLKTTASSTIVDLAGDEMELSALQRMATTAQQNMTIFLNHKYQVPEDVLGSVEHTEIKSDDGVLYDLDFQIKVDESNPRAVTTWNQINNGTKLGCSIGARIPSGGYEKSDTGLKIKDIQLMEASIVGIPANPRSFVQHAMKALHAAELEEDEVTTATESVNINLNLGEAATATVGEAGPETTTVLRETPAPEEAEPLGDTEDEAEGVADSESLAPLLGDSDTPTESADGPPAEGDSADSDEPSQEADKSVPESDGIDDEDTRAVIAKGIETLEALLHRANDELVAVRKTAADETEARVKAERERDEARENLKLARDIVERINALPIGRRTSFKAAASEFRTRFSGVYDDEVLKLLERESNGG